MIEYEFYKQILALWESGMNKKAIAKQTGFSLYKVRQCLQRFNTLSELENYASTDTSSIDSLNNGRRNKYSPEQLIEATQTSFSFAQTLRKLDLQPAGGNYATLKQWISELEIDISHFRGKGWSRESTIQHTRRRKLKDILKDGTSYRSSLLRQRLIDENIFDHKCVSCENTTWLGKAIPLELDHINGNRYDNRIENLRLLCPNCHALTATYRGRNIAIK